MRKLALGFSFLRQEAGFGISFSIIPYAETDTYLRVFLVGLSNTLLVALLGIIAATLLGFAIGIARLSPNWAVAKAALVYVETVRNLPLLLHVLIWYNVVIRSLPPSRQAVNLLDAVFLSNRGIFVPSLETSLGWETFALLVGGAVAAIAGIVRRARRWREETGQPTRVVIPIVFIFAGALLLVAGWGQLRVSWPALQGFNFSGGMALSPELAALVVALAVYNASFIAELVRGSIEAIGKGQREAAAALGLDRGRILKLVIIPQAMRVLVPPLTNQYLHLVKASSLATVIGYPDLVNVFVGTSLNQTGRAIEIMAMTMAVYLVLSLAITGLSNLQSRRLRLVER
ncbi:amino acid ABC transporter permease [Bosea eneae]|uniref:Amino acid ABC transporter permease n=1 Tax=Bosea eneae TaxID=151454 RepID=A0ABW0IZ16_9HYPH